MIGTYYEMSFCHLNVETKIQDVPKNFLHYVVVSINHFQNEKHWFEHHGIDAIINNNMALGIDWTFPENQPPEGKNYSSDVYKKLCKHFDCILELKTTKMPFSKLDNIEHHRIIVNSDGDILLEERTTQSCEEDAPYFNLNFGKKTLEEVLGDEAIPAEYHVANDFFT